LARGAPKDHAALGHSARRCGCRALRDIRHGIYRDFPLTFKDAGGVIREVDFSLISVERDGRPEEYSTTASAASSASIPAAKARSFQAASYVFRYRTGRQVRWFDGKPELNWNVTGNFWRFPIMTASYHPAICRRR
jgi:hypothetical protein